MSIRIEYKLADMWVGAYWNKERVEDDSILHIWICLVPCFPIHVQIPRRAK